MRAKDYIDSKTCLIWCTTRLLIVSVIGTLMLLCLMLQFDILDYFPLKHSVGEPIRGGNNIIFVEMSCLFGESNEVLSIRDTCSIESAAKMNPHAEVYLLHSCPIELTANEPVTKLRKYYNIKFWKLDLDNLISGTILKEWDYNSVIKNVLRPIEHIRDMIRFLILWKYGGLYMDLNFITIKSMSILDKNFIVAASNNTVHNNILKLNYDVIGHKFADICIRQATLINSYAKDITYNGNVRVTNCLLDLCKINELSELDPAKCQISIYSPENFFPIGLENRKLLFDISRKDYVYSRIVNSIAMYMWNDVVYDEIVYPETDQPYSLIAKTYCPRVYASTADFF